MHGSFIQQNIKMNELLVRLGLREFDLREDQTVYFDDNVPVLSQGTGLRSTFAILAALTNANVKAILIDEPELSLEPRLAKVLRDVLVEASEEKTIVVATHSHLFVRRDMPEANQLLRRDETTNNTEVITITEGQELYDVVFALLGNSTEDLFFPGNYLVVEGASDQEIVTKVLTLLGSPPPTVKVLAARGIDAVRDAVEAVYRASVPMIVNDSPYAERVVALIDAPTHPEGQNMTRLKGALGDRLYELDAPSMEAYLPDSLYERAGRDKAEDASALTSVTGDRRKTAELKREISKAVAASMTHDDLAAIPTVAEAARRAISLAT
jgi:hypothetical protein